MSAIARLNPGLRADALKRGIMEAVPITLAAGTSLNVDARGHAQLVCYPSAGGSVKYSAIHNPETEFAHGFPPAPAASAADEVVTIDVRANFYRIEAVMSDLIVHRACGGGGGSAPPTTPDGPLFPGADTMHGFISGQYYGTATGTGNSTQAKSDGNLFVVPFIVPADRDFDQMAMRVVTGAASALIRVGLYNEENGHPSSLVFEAGAIDASVSGLRTVAITETVPKGLYWLAALFEDGAPTVRVQNQHGFLQLRQDDSQVWQGLFKSGVTTGALPDPAPAMSGSQLCPVPLIRAA